MGPKVPTLGIVKVEAAFLPLAIGKDASSTLKTL